MHRDATLLDQRRQILDVRNRLAHVGPSIKVHDIRTLGIRSRHEDNAIGALGKVSHELSPTAIGCLFPTCVVDDARSGGIVRFIEDHHGPRRNRTQDFATTWLCCILTQRLHLAVGREDHICHVIATQKAIIGFLLGRRRSAREELASALGSWFAGLLSCLGISLPFDGFFIERNCLARIRGENVRLAT